MSILRAVDPGSSGLSVEMNVWGKPHGSWKYQYDEDCWTITWHYNFVDAGRRLKTMTFKKLKDLPLW